MAMVSPVAAGDALDGLIAEQEAALIARTTRSHELHAEALHHLPGGVASSWQDAPPCPVFLEHGRGSRVWDVDGTEYVDLHAGFGTMIAGHAHPALVAAISDRVRLARTSPNRCPTSSPSPASWLAASGSRCGGSPTRGPKRPSPRSTSPVRPPVAPTSSRSRAATTATTTPCRCPCIPTSPVRVRRNDRIRSSSTPPSHRPSPSRRTSCRSANSTPYVACCSIIPDRSRR